MDIMRVFRIGRISFADKLKLIFCSVLIMISAVALSGDAEKRSNPGKASFKWDSDALVVWEIFENDAKEYKTVPEFTRPSSRESEERYFRFIAEMLSRQVVFIRSLNYDNCSSECRTAINEYRMMLQQCSDITLETVRQIASGNREGYVRSLRRFMVVQCDISLIRAKLYCIAFQKNADPKSFQKAQSEFIDFIVSNKPQWNSGVSLKSVKKIPEYIQKLHDFRGKICNAERLAACGSVFLKAFKAYYDNLNFGISTLENMPYIPSDKKGMVLLAAGTLLSPRSADKYKEELGIYSRKFTQYAETDKKTFQKMKDIAAGKH